MIEIDDVLFVVESPFAVGTITFGTLQWGRALRLALQERTHASVRAYILTSVVEVSVMEVDARVTRVPRTSNVSVDKRIRIVLNAHYTDRMFCS